ncbi:flavodoxins [Longilinea arvoryzae]|uniref:Flavodoxins n=1 Tax=Longilinea arvoryzae TaxID=360412 RepID=A0A0S7BJG1_9CHLR|nr:flavodoxin [Longilinea arvoryzae]GAP15785.1 flavodoxins [Longilinea arvoryzae]
MNSEKSKILIAYFSHSGNTRTIAEEIRKNVGGDLFEIATIDPYARDYNTVVDVARREQTANRRPELTAKVENLVAYDVIFLGFPNWWGTMPMAVFTFLGQSDFSGKRILPFCTHEGSGMGRSESDIQKLCPGATVLKGFAVRGSHVHAARVEIADWLRQTGMGG